MNKTMIDTYSQMYNPIDIDDGIKVGCCEIVDHNYEIIKLARVLGIKSISSMQKIGFNTHPWVT